MACDASRTVVKLAAEAPGTAARSTPAARGSVPSWKNALPGTVRQTCRLAGSAPPAAGVKAKLRLALPDPALTTWGPVALSLQK